MLTLGKITWRIAPNGRMVALRRLRRLLGCLGFIALSLPCWPQETLADYASDFSDTCSKAVSSPKNILDYFITWPNTGFDNDGFAIMSEKRGALYPAIGSAEYKLRKEYVLGAQARDGYGAKFLVDLDNDFLTVDGSSGGGDYHLEFTFFDRKGGSPIVAVSSVFDGPDGASYSYAFYSIEEGDRAWREVTQSVFPLKSLERIQRRLGSDGADLVQWELKLPEEGGLVSATAYLSLDGEGDPGDYTRLEKRLNDDGPASLTFEWDYAAGRFRER